jgi:predicted nucleic acid-binding protein
MYLDSSYIAKFYVNEEDSRPVRELIRGAEQMLSSACAIAEVSCALHRHMREGGLGQAQFRELLDAFLDHIEAGFWTLLPMDPDLLRRAALRVRALPAMDLRANYAIHLATAQDAGEREIWTSDRKMLAAAPYFGIKGRSV